MKKGEKKKCSIVAIKGIDGWQSLARTVLYFAEQESRGVILRVSRHSKTEEQIIKEARDFMEADSEYKELLKDIANYEKNS